MNNNNHRKLIDLATRRTQRELDALNRQMSADCASIKSALTCSTPGHDFRGCPDCQVRLARIREAMGR